MNMSIKNEIEVVNIGDFWSRLRKSKCRFVALDYDGTLAPFRAERMEAHPLPGVPDLLRRLAESENTSLAIISGRPISELLSFLDVGDITYVGSHGFEVMNPAGDIVITSPKPEQLHALEVAEQIAVRLGFDQHLETKVASVALHTRKMSPEMAAGSEDLIYAEWSCLAKSELECLRFDGGVEFRALGRDKGSVLQNLLSQQPPEAFSIFVGDDKTDEDAFRVLRGRGIGIKVGDPVERTAAEGFLPDIPTVRDFLKQYLSIISAEAS